MNAQLKSFLTRVARSPDFEILHYHQGNFTVCVLRQPDTYVIYSVGVSKRNPNCDAVDRNRGKMISYVRAVRQLWDGDTEHI